MKINNIIAATAKPPLYTPGTAVMWNDPYISTQLLPFHLNEELDIASRLPDYIDRTVDWILSQSPEGETGELSILDLGCGPGLYAERLAARGHKVTGVDFSSNSIEYARKSAAEKGLNIDYICSNYLELKPDRKRYDLIIMIYCDFGVLVPRDRSTLLSWIGKHLNKGGRFLFDVLNDRDFENKISPDSWTCSEKGFWRDRPHLVLSRSHVYEGEKVILEQHTVITDGEETEIYRFWTHFLDREKIGNILSEAGFAVVTQSEEVLPPGTQWTGENITFTAAVRQ